MAKLVALSKLVAEVTGLSPARVRVLEMVLRKAGMITSGGRGLHAAEMKPSDATNMLLAALHQGAATEADIGVQKLRALEFHYLEIDNFENERGARRFPILDAEIHLPSSLSVPSNLGEALDWLFANPDFSVNPYDDIELSQTSGWTEVRLSLSEPEWFDGCGFQNDDKRWSLGFLSHEPTGSRYTAIRTTRFMNPGLQHIGKLIAGIPL